MNAQKQTRTGRSPLEGAARCTLAIGLAVTALAAGSYEVVAQPVGTSDLDLAKIEEAHRSAPAELAADATILDWPQEPGGPFPVLRRGTNEWYCLPDYPADASFAPECFDEQWLEFVKAYVAGTRPSVERLGLSYMLDSRWAVSNTDRTAMAPTPDNQWHEGGAHLMLVVPDPSMLASFPTEPTPKGGAYVMFAGTPYAHLMIPIPRLDSRERANR